MDSVAKDESSLLKAAVPSFAMRLACTALDAALCAARRLAILSGLKTNTSPAESPPPPQNPSSLRVMFTSSDNDSTSGAFLCMLELATSLKRHHNIDPIVILPCQGSGTALLAQASIPYLYVPSSDWTLPLSANHRSFSSARSIVRRHRLNHTAIRRIASLAQTLAVDISHNNTSWNPTGTLAARKARIPCIWHIRELLEEGQSRKLWSPSVCCSIFASANQLVATSKSIERKDSPLLPPGKITTIYDGCDVSRFLQPSRTILQSTPFTFIMVGGICAYKGHTDFAQACARLYTQGFRSFKILFVGNADPQTKSFLDSTFAAAGMSHLVEYCGRQPHPETFFSRADIAFTCSIFEAFGRVTVEAMLSGCLLIGRASGATSELVSHGSTGLLYSPQGDIPGNLCAQILHAVSHPSLMRTIAAAGRSHMASQMNLQRNVSSIASLYHSITSTPSPAN